jgi:hypothetical protein
MLPYFINIVVMRSKLKKCTIILRKSRDANRETPSQLKEKASYQVKEIENSKPVRSRRDM